MTMDQLKADKNGLETYDYIVNNLDSCAGNMEFLTENLLKADTTGQYLTSTAIFLNKVGKERFGKWIDRLIEGAIAKDRERRYIGSLLEAIWGVDFKDRSSELNQIDDNFRRIYKRIYPENAEKI